MHSDDLTMPHMRTVLELLHGCANDKKISYDFRLARMSFSAMIAANHPHAEICKSQENGRTGGENAQLLVTCTASIIDASLRKNQTLSRSAGCPNAAQCRLSLYPRFVHWAKVIPAKNH